MKKLRFLPSILMLIVCVGVLVAGVYAAVPTQNKIHGNIIVNASNAEVDIECIIDGESFETYTEVRKGVPIDIKKLAFNVDGVNNAYEVKDIEVIIKITNKSEKPLGAYYCLTNKEDDAKAEDILFKDPINGTGDLSSDTVATAYFKGYSYIAPKSDPNGYNVLEMPVMFRCNSLDSVEITSEKFLYYLNIEQYSTTITEADIKYDDTTSTGSASLSGLVKLPETMIEVPASAFKNNANVTNVVLPTSITNIGASAFAGSGLTSLAIPESVNTFGKSIAQNSKIVTAMLPENMTDVPSFMAAACAKLECVKFSSQTEYIREQAFNGCSIIEKYFFPEKLNFLGRGAFYNNYKLKEVILPNSLTTMQDLIFTNCTSVEKVVFPTSDNFTKTGSGMFIGNTSLKYVEIPSNITILADQTFVQSGIEKVKFNEGLRIIEFGAFGETALNSVIFPKSLESIDMQAFMGCSNLKTVKFNEGLTEIGRLAFSDTSLEEVVFPHSLENIRAGAFAYNKLKSIDLASVKTIEMEAFCNCDALESIVIPNTVENIGVKAFYHCDNLKTALIKADLKNIPEYMFAYCTKLTNITIPLSVELLENGCLASSAISEITIPNSVKVIDADVFYGCKSLVKVNIGSGVEEIRYGAFDNTGLTEIILPNSLKNISTYAFGNISLTNYKTYQNGKYLGTNANPYMMLMGVTSTEITSFNFHSDCEYILTNAFKNCSNLEDLVLPNGIKSIGQNAFSGCTKLLQAGKDGNFIYLGTESNSKYALIGYDSSVTITNLSGINSNTNILIDGAFKSLTSLTSATIPTSITKIGHSTFYGCTALSEISFAHVTEIEESAFEKCSALKSVEIPQAIEFLGNKTFSECTSLNNVVIHENIKRLTFTFYKCSKLTNVTIESGEVFKRAMDPSSGYIIMYAKEVKVLASIVNSGNYRNEFLETTIMWQKTLSGNYYIYTKLF